MWAAKSHPLEETTAQGTLCYARHWLGARLVLKVRQEGVLLTLKTHWAGQASGALTGGAAICHCWGPPVEVRRAGATESARSSGAGSSLRFSPVAVLPVASLHCQVDTSPQA